MKKLFQAVTVLLLCAALLCPAAGALQGDALIAREGRDGFNDSVQAICAFDDALWLLAYRDGVYEYRDGELMRYSWDEEYAASAAGVYDLGGEKVYRSIDCMFAWNDKLHALAETVSVESGVMKVDLCEIIVANGAASIETIREIDWKPGVSDEYFSVDGCVVVGDVLCANLNMRYETLCLIPLDGADMIITDIQNASLSAYGDKLLAVSENYGDSLGYAFYEVDPLTGAPTEIARVEDIDGYLSGAVWSPEIGKLLCEYGGRLVAYDIFTGKYENIASMPIEPMYASGGLILGGEIYAAYGYDGVVLRRFVNRAAAECELVIAEQMGNGAIGDAAIEYPMVNPNVEIARVNADNALDLLLTRSPDVDIFVLYSHDPEGALDAVLERGWAAPIESEALVNAVNEMYPALREWLTYDGKLIAVPLEAFATGFGINVGALEKLGQTMDDVPTNWPDFLTYIGSLADNGVVPVIGEGDAEQVPSNILLQLFADYSLEIVYGGRTEFDTPEFRAIMDALERLDFAAMEANGAEIDYDGNPLLSYYENVGIVGDTNTDEYSFYPLRLSISADSPIYMPLETQIAIINPASAHIAEATELLETAWSLVDPKTRAMLCPAYQQPLYDTAMYESSSEDVTQRIAGLKAQLDNAESGADAIEAEIEQAERVLREMEDWYWIISPASLEWYAAHDDYVVLQTAGVVGGIDLYSLTWKYFQSDGSADELIAEIDRMFRMKRLEKE